MAGIAVPIAWGALEGQLLLAVLASLGGLYAGLASFGNVHAVRLRRMAWTTLVVSALTVLGSLARGSDLATILAATAAASVFAAYGATSARNSIVGILGTAILLIVSGLPPTGAGPLGEGLAVLLGGALETLVLALAGPLFPRSIERRAVAEAFESLARYVEDSAQAPRARVPDATPFHEARSRLEEGAQFRPADEHERLRHALRTAETLRAALVGYAQAQKGSRLPEVDAQVAHALDDLAKAVLQGRTNVLEVVPEPIGASPELRRWIGLLNATFEEMARPPVPGESLSAESAPARTAWLGSLAGLWSSRNLRSITFSHSLRFGATVGIGTAIYRLLEIPLGYWIPLTVVFLLRPDYSTTLLKGLARFVGTFGGVAVASAVAALAHPEPLAASGLAVLGGWFAFALYEVSFTAYIGALTFYVVLGISAQGQPETVVGLERMFSTTVGAALSVVATLAWPLWESGRVRGVLREAFLSQVEYGEALARLVHGGPVDGAEEARHRTRSLRVEAERLLSAAQVEPRWSRAADPDAAARSLEALNENAAILLSLHAQALEQRAGRVPDDPDSRQELQRAISSARLWADQAE